MADDEKRISKQKRLNTKLLEAVYSKDLEKVKSQIENGAHPGTRCQKNLVSSTHIAAYHGSVKILKELLQKDVDLKVRDIRGLQPHHLAAFRKESLECLKIILDKQNDLIDSPVILDKTKLTLQDAMSDSYGHNHDLLTNLVREEIEEGATALYIATKNGLTEVVRELLKRKATVTEKIIQLIKTLKTKENDISLLIKIAHANHPKMGQLQMAVFEGNVEDVDQCLQKMENEDQIDHTLLHLAVQNELRNESNKNDYTEILAMLADTKGVNINHRNEYDKTPLYLATEGRWIDDMDCLLKKNADESIPCQKGETVFHVAARNKDYNILKYLLEKKPNSNALLIEDVEGYTPLYRAVKTGCPKCVQALLETPLNNDCKLISKDQKDTILHAAIESSWNKDVILQKILEFLLKENSPESISILNKTNSEGLTAVELAAKKGEGRCLDVLLQCDKVNVTPMNTDKNHDTALHHAARNGYFKCLEILIDRCEDIDMLDNSNNLTALIYAARGGYSTCVKLLLKRGANLAIKDLSVNRTAIDIIMSNVPRAVEMIDDILDSFIIQSKNSQPDEAATEASTENNKKTLDKEKTPLLNSINNDDHKKINSSNTSLDQVVIDISMPNAPTTVETEVTTKASSNDNNQINSNIPDHKKKPLQNNSHNNEHYKIHMVTLDYKCLIAGSRQLEVIETVNDCKYDKLKQKFFLHPVVKTFLIHKWKQINNLFLTLLIVYLIHAISVTCLAIFTTVYPQFIPACIFFILTLLTIIPVALVETVTWLEDVKLYSRFETYIKWIAILMTGLFSVVSIFWQNSYFASVTVLLSWMELLLFNAMSCNGGFYILLFFKIAKNVFQVLSFFIFLIVGFSLSFFILFKGRKPFPDPFTSFGAVIAMISELNYDEAFEKETDSILIILGHILFIIFYVLGVMVMMNLIIGLSVNTVTEHEGKCKHLAMQGSFLSLVDKFCGEQNKHHKYGKPHKLIIWLRNLINLDNKLTKGNEKFKSLTIFPNHLSKDNILGKELIYEVMEIVNNKVKRYRPENMVQKMNKMGERVDEVIEMVSRRP